MSITNGVLTINDVPVFWLKNEKKYQTMARQLAVGSYCAVFNYFMEI